MLYEVLKQLNQLLESIKSAELIWSLSLLIVRLLVHAIDVLEYRRGKKKKKIVAAITQLTLFIPASSLIHSKFIDIHRFLSSFKKNKKKKKRIPTWIIKFVFNRRLNTIRFFVDKRQSEFFVLTGVQKTNVRHAN